ncbi:MAG: M48 family metallopeptidase, partial [Eubacteriales bacterium]|nr:M48 family metallopeptidase [Eubacteriales bacterium]
LGITYGRVAIRAQRSRWGSCSSKGNLNFNCLLMLTPREVIDSVIVHELCHRKQLNHSKAFWALVYEAMPDYKVWDKWLKDHGRELISALPK